MKICSICKELKLETEFHKRSKSKDKLHSYCKSCRHKIFKEEYERCKKDRLCFRCFKKPMMEESNLHCYDCYKKANGATRKYHISHRKEEREKTRLIYIECKKNGICCSCRKNPIGPKSINLCNTCLERKNYRRQFTRGRYPDLNDKLSEVKTYLEGRGKYDSNN